jgi:hypothetical protein
MNEVVMQRIYKLRKKLRRAVPPGGRLSVQSCTSELVQRFVADRLRNKLPCICREAQAA